MINTQDSTIHIWRASESPIRQMTVKPAKDFSPEVESQVNILWKSALKRSPWLHDGQVFSLETPVEQIRSKGSSENAFGSFMNYRYWLALREDIRLRQSYNLVPVAVTGVLSVTEGLVFGLRSKKSTQDAGMWELLPAGGIDEHSMSGGQIFAERQLFSELKEETGLLQSDLESWALQAYMWDGNVFDFVYELKSACAFSELQQRFGRLSRPEHLELRCIPISGGALFDQIRENLAPASLAILKFFNYRLG